MYTNVKLLMSPSEIPPEVFAIAVPLSVVVLMLLRASAIRGYRAFRSLHSFWLSDPEASRLSYGKFLFGFFFSSLYDSNDSKHRLTGIKLLKSAATYFSFSIAVAIATRYGGYEYLSELYRDAVSAP